MNKKLLPLFIACSLCFQCTKAQYVTIPDPNFVNWIAGSNVHQCLNGLGQLDTTCQGLLQDTVLICSGNQIGNLIGIQYFKNLKYLDCSFNLLDSLTQLPGNLQILICNQNSIRTFVSLPDQLEFLYCEDNKLVTINSLPPRLVGLHCADNLLDSLPSLPGVLDTLDCPLNFLISLPAFPNTLRALICYQNSLNILPNATSLKYLDCTSNQISVLPGYYDSLNYIRCSHNQISRLPLFSNSLIYLDCSYNNIDSIISLPNGLIDIICGFNQLKSLSSRLPDSLQSIACYNNLLTILPPLPKKVTSLVVQGNLLAELPELPDSMYSLDCYNNPYLRCLPKLTTINFLNFDSTAIICLPNYGNVTTSTPPLNSLPLCDSTNNSGCPYYTSIPDIKNLAFSISPNPTSNEALLTLDESVTEFSITVFDITGRKVITEKNHIGACTLSVNQLPAGLYFVQLSDNRGGVGVKKLIVEH